MSGRNVFLVTYDIGDKRRLRQIHKRMRGYGDPLQYSVFRCELSSKERELMITALTDIINHDVDRILIVDLGPADGRGARTIQFLGRRVPHPQEGPVVF